MTRVSVAAVEADGLRDEHGGSHDEVGQSEDRFPTPGHPRLPHGGLRGFHLFNFLDVT